MSFVKQRTLSGATKSQPGNETRPRSVSNADRAAAAQSKSVNLVICILGIYISFITWGVFQEQLTSAKYESIQYAYILLFSKKLLSVFDFVKMFFLLLPMHTIEF